MSATSSHRVFGGFAAVAVVLVIVGAANVLVGNLNLRADLTEEKLYTLSAGTREVLGKLEAPVTLKFFFNGSEPQVPPGIKLFARSVEDLLREYEISGKGRIVVEKHDPKPDSDAADWARRYGIEPQSPGMYGPEIYLGLVAVKGDAEAALPVLNPQEDAKLEYDITRMISRVANPKKPVVGLMTQLPVMGAPQMPFGPQPQQGGQPWFAFGDLQRDCDVRTVADTAEKIDDDIDALILVHPQNLSDAALFAIDQFVLRGGKLLAFLDPLCLVEDRGNPMGMQMGGGGSNLDKLTSAWGVTFQSDRVLADLEAVTPVRGRDGRPVENPTWLSLRHGNMNEKDNLVAQLESMMMPCAGAFRVEPQAGVEVSTLMSTSESAGLVDSMAAKFGAEGLTRGLKIGMRREPLALRISGKLKSAFPEGKPKAAEEEKKDDAAGDQKDEAKKDEAKKDEAKKDEGPAALKESKGQGMVILVGDVDFLYDAFCLREVNIPGFGQVGMEPWNDNLSFFFNTIEQILGNPSLAGIRTRGKTDRPFDEVVRRLRIAEEKYMAEEEALQKKIEQTEQRLSELQAQKGKGQEMIPSPEQKAEIARFRKEELATRQALKELRKNLRSDIERLGNAVKAVNILAVPLLISLVGIGFGLWRRNRR